ncbi:MAG: LytTR family DNA-binding domain-containing protein [Steroidobacteraceae bacterium]
MAANYLLKPVSDVRLARCAAREYLSWLKVELALTTRLVAAKSVLYLRSTEKYTEVATAHDRHLIRTPLKELLHSLGPTDLAQIRRSTIVNLAAIERLERDVRSVSRTSGQALTYTV